MDGNNNVGRECKQRVDDIADRDTVHSCTAHGQKQTDVGNFKQCETPASAEHAVVTTVDHSRTYLSVSSLQYNVKVTRRREPDDFSNS